MSVSIMVTNHLKTRAEPTTEI